MQVANYVRVSTEDQDLQRQLEATLEYADQLGSDQAIETFRDKSTGTNTDRREFQQLLERAEEFDAIVTMSVSRLARSVRDFEDVVDRIVEDADTELHIISEGFEIRPDDSDPYQRAMLQMLSVFAELEAEMAQARTRTRRHTSAGGDSRRGCCRPPTRTSLTSVSNGRRWLSRTVIGRDPPPSVIAPSCTGVSRSSYRGSGMRSQPSGRRVRDSPHIHCP